ncbi:uncharacterized protein LOC123296689 isoform X2 [Chrysoperla carnea]|uniref:uncharacterized protein LOC123296689 isoform X2 n=1 Tax=Chrysoperla carnea TaxID=189513 RepID=UPI001D080986|nr:uncharacterized protein LOC123296689 isoform X2 [Chrysoperla carnea]
MVFLKQTFVFLVIAVAIQSTQQAVLQRECPKACPKTYDPLCGVNESGQIKKIFPNRCLFNVEICLNSEEYDSFDWHTCSPEERKNYRDPNSGSEENPNNGSGTNGSGTNGSGNEGSGTNSSGVKPNSTGKKQEHGFAFCFFFICASGSLP